MSWKLLLCVLLIAGCTSSDDSSLLTPARELEGEWSTEFPVTFHIMTDFSSFELVDVGSEDRLMSFVITTTSDPNVVGVEVSFSSSNRSLIVGSGYTPDVSPMFLEGVINGSELTLLSGERVIGVFSFTSDLMMGTWFDSWELAYAQEVYTDVNALKLVRQ